MDHRNVKDEDGEVDLESGLALTKDDSNDVSTPINAKQGKTLFAKISCGLGDFVKDEGRNSVSCDESNFSVVSKLLTVQDSVECARNSPVKEKRKKSSNKKSPPKPPRPPQAPPLDAADYKLIKEISELAMLKRARIERMKALKKMKAAKSSSSSSSSMFALVFTIVFCIVILLQGMSSGKTSVASFQGSPLSTEGADVGFIAVQNHLNPSSSDPNALGLETHRIVQRRRLMNARYRDKKNAISVFGG